MHDIKLIRENPAAFDAGLAPRGPPAQSAGPPAAHPGRPDPLLKP